MSLIILNFHGVGPVSRNMDAAERECWLDQSTFETVLDLVRDFPDVRLTIDDGNASDFEVVLPELLRRELRATFFICSGRVDQPSFLTGSQLRELVALGMTIGSHGAAHRSWRWLSASQLNIELECSRHVLEDACGVPVESAACPFGAYDHKVLKSLRLAHYRFVYTSDGGTTAESDWLRARTTVTRSMNIGDIRNLILKRSGFWNQWSIDARKVLKRLR